MTDDDRSGSRWLALVAVGGAVLAFSLTAGSLGTVLDAELGVDSGPANEARNKSGRPPGPGGGGTADGPSGESAIELLPSSTVVDRARQWLPLAGLVMLAGAVAVLWSVGAGERVDPPSGGEREDGDGLDVSVDGRRETSYSLDEPVTNDVYRAWVEFRELVADPDGTTTETPTELSRTAGNTTSEESVATLLETFQRVRYRGDQATDQRERRAREALARIQDAYESGTGSGIDDAEDESGTDSTGADSGTDDEGEES